MLKNVLMLTVASTMAMASVGLAQEAGDAGATEEQAALPDVTTGLGLFV